eukprot:3139780-Prymnesium_polylepis.1
MPVGYYPKHFWSVAFAWSGSALGHRDVWIRAAVLLPPAIVAALLDYFDVIDPDDLGQEWNAQEISAPFAVLVGLMTSFRLSDAFQKWERASQLMLQLHEDARQICSQLSAYLPGDVPE